MHIKTVVIIFFALLFLPACVTTSANASFLLPGDPNTNIPSMKVKIKPGNCGGGMKIGGKGELSDACVEGFASACLDVGCHMLVFHLAEVAFVDQGWRYNAYPFQDPDGFYITGSGEKPVSFKADVSYFSGMRQSNELDASGSGFRAELWMPSGFTFSASYLYAEENPDEDISPYIWSYTYFRFGMNHHLIADSNAWLTLGAFGCFLDAEVGDSTYDYLEYEDQVGFGAELSGGVLVREPLAVYGIAAPAVTTEGTLADFEGGFVLFAGPVGVKIGYRLLSWDEDNLQGIKIGLNLWF